MPHFLSQPFDKLHATANSAAKKKDIDNWISQRVGGIVQSPLYNIRARFRYK